MNQNQSTTVLKTKGQARAEEIKSLAKEILAFEGYSNFTLRNISSRLSISMGNLNYYFAKKNDLLYELIKDAQAEYETNTEAIFDQINLSSAEQFEQFISYLINDLQSSVTRGFFLQVWAIATHDQEVEGYRKDFYDYGLNRVSGLIQAMTSGVRKESVRARATLIIAAIEGSMLLLNSKSNDDEYKALYLNKLKQQCLDIALNG